MGWMGSGRVMSHWVGSGQVGFSVKHSYLVGRRDLTERFDQLPPRVNKFLSNDRLRGEWGLPVGRGQVMLYLSIVLGTGCQPRFWSSGVSAS